MMRPYAVLGENRAGFRRPSSDSTATSGARMMAVYAPVQPLHGPDPGWRGLPGCGRRPRVDPAGPGACRPVRGGEHSPRARRRVLRCRATTRTRRRAGSRSRRSPRTMSPGIRTCGRRSSGSFAPVRCRRSERSGPDDATYDAVIASLETSLDRAAAAKPNPGRTATIRRLTRTEYQNAIRDLLALEIDVASLLPADESSYGFDNVTVGDLSPTLLDRYVSAAENDQPGGGRTSEPFSGRRHHQDSAGPHAGRTPRRPADRHPRRRRGPLHVSARRRVRDPDSTDAGPRRARRGPERAARSRAAAGSGAGAGVHGETAAARGRRLADAISPPTPRSIST